MRFLLIIFMFIGCAAVNAAPKHVYTVEEIVDEIKTYDNLTSWFNRNFKYKADKSEKYEWRTAAEALQDGFGDCEEYSQIAMAVLKGLGINDVYLMGVTKIGRSYGHVVTVFRTNKKDNWKYFDFESLKIGSFDFTELPKIIGRSQRYGSKVKYRLADSNLKNVTPEEEINLGLHS